MTIGFITFLNAQVGINTETPATTLDVVGEPADPLKLDGIMAPRLSGDDLRSKSYTAAQTGALLYVTAADSSPAGQTVNVTATGYYYFDGTVWVKTSGSGGSDTEPWYNQLTHTGATSNAQDVYMGGSVAIGKTFNHGGTALFGGAALDVQGAVRGGNNQDGSVGLSSVAFGAHNEASGDYSAALGLNNTASGENAIAGGSGSIASGASSVAFGDGNEASGNSSAALGLNNTASGENAIAGGFGSIASGANSIAIGTNGTIASGYNSKNFGASSVASASNAFIAGGINNTAASINTLVSGSGSTANGQNSFATGQNSIASSLVETVIGRNNAVTTGSVNAFIATDAAFQIGNGTSSATNRNNAMTVLKDGSTGIGIAGAEEVAKPTERLDIGSGNVRIREINSNAGTAGDKYVVADSNGVLKTVTGSPTTAPMNVIYQTGSYTALPTDDIILYTNHTVGTTLTLPTTGVPVGKKIFVSNNGSSDVQLNPLPREGATNRLITGQGNILLYTGDPTSPWSIISGY